MTTETGNRKPLAYSLIAAGFALQLGACVLMLFADGRDVVQPGGAMLICGMGLGWRGVAILRKQQQG